MYVTAANLLGPQRIPYFVYTALSALCMFVYPVCTAPNAVQRPARHPLNLRSVFHAPCSSNLHTRVTGSVGDDSSSIQPSPCRLLMSTLVEAALSRVRRAEVAGAARVPLLRALGVEVVGLVVGGEGVGTAVSAARREEGGGLGVPAVVARVVAARVLPVVVLVTVSLL